MPSFIIVGYVCQILGRGSSPAPQPPHPIRQQPRKNPSWIGLSFQISIHLVLRFSNCFYHHFYNRTLHLSVPDFLILDFDSFLTYQPSFLTYTNFEGYINLDSLNRFFPDLGFKLSFSRFIHLFICLFIYLYIYLFKVEQSK